jgi:hypothetical protein
MRTLEENVPGSVLEEEFRRLLLAALVGAERLTEEFAANLRSWTPSGFSAYPASRVDALDLDGLERLARYVTRPALSAGAVTLREDGRVDVATPRDPSTGSASVTMDALDFVHAVGIREYGVRHVVLNWPIAQGVADSDRAVARLR